MQIRNMQIFCIEDYIQLRLVIMFRDILERSGKDCENERSFFSKSFVFVHSCSKKFE